LSIRYTQANLQYISCLTTRLDTEPAANVKMTSRVKAVPGRLDERWAPGDC